MQQGVCVVQRELLEQLREITEEERRILNGEAEVDRDLYTSGSDFTIDSNKMLEEGKLIAIRTHTRFVHFPLHRHNYVEVLYVCEGTLTNVIDGKQVIVRKGELLFLNQFTHHEILPAGQEDIAINFIILPEFFDRITKGFGRKESGHLSFRAKKTEVEKKLNLCYHFDKYRSF